jgi:DNA primase
MARIPEETLQQVLAATDLVDLIGRSVKLRRAGGNFVGLCPFHNEKSPSFNVRPSTNTYHCFGCGAGGNAFRFLMEHEGLSFVEAVRRLADAAGIRVEEEVWDANAEQAARQRSLLLRVHQEIAAWYHELLLRSPLAEPARDYLKGRGISSTVAKNWQVGYAPAAGSQMRQWAQGHKFGRDLLIEAGLLAWSEEKGEAYPRFRNRLMFPIRNENGEVIGFSGRLLSADAKAAKYLNSPETPLFNKSKVLFGFDKARRAIAKAGQAIVCEGQIDTIMVHEAGFPNVVAGQGTAFTELHARALKRLADEVVLCYDSDNAGYKAAERAFQALAPYGLIIKVAALPAGEDPDSFIRSRGTEAFAELLKGAKDFVDHQLDSAASRRNLAEVRERIRFAEEMAENVRLFESPLARQTTIQRVARRLDIPEDVMAKLVADASRRAAPRRDKAAAGAAPKRDLLGEQDKTALLLTRMALADARVLAWLRQSGQEQVLDELPGLELLACVWRGRFDPLEPSALNAFLAGLTPALQSALTRLLHEPPPPGGVEDAHHALMALQIASLKMRRQRYQTQLKDPAIRPEDIAELQREIVELHQEILRLREILRQVKPSA